MGTLWNDVKHGVRLLLKSKGFTISALAVLALGIGANTAIFSVVNTVLLKPLPFHDGDRLTYVLHRPPAKAFPGIPVFSASLANYLDWRAQNHSFEAMSALRQRSVNLTGVDKPEAIRASIVEPDFFTILRARPEMGRPFSAEETEPGKEHVVVLSHKFWQDHLGGERSAIGRNVVLDGNKCTIIGVMPATFSFEAWSMTNADVWMPFAWTPKDRAVRKNHNYLTIARLKDGVSLPAAQTEMDTISKRLEAQYPEDNSGWGAVVLPLREDLFGDVRPALLVLLGAVAFVLLIACANVANLIMVRNLSRRKEMAIRAALGASRARAARQMLTEAMLLSVAGGAIGLFVARSGIEVIATFLADELPRATELRIDTPVLIFALFLSLVTGLLAGLIPALRTNRLDLNDALKQGFGRTDSDTTGGNTRSWLVVAEVALCLVLLVGAGLMMQTLWALRQVDAGINPDRVLTMSIAIPKAKYSEPAQQTRFFQEVLSRVRALPGVVAASGTDTLPFQGGGSTQPVVIEGRPAEKFAEQPEVGVRRVMPGYLKAMGIQLLQGRDITDADRENQPDVALISAAMAKQFWPNQDPIGKRLTLSFSPEKQRTVIGVVGNVKETGLAAAQALSTMYVSSLQVPADSQELVIRTSTPPQQLIAGVTEAIHAVDREQPVRDVHTMEELVESSMFQQRFSMYLLMTFAGLALLLASIGIYSVLAYAVRRRMREIGVRLALGAAPVQVLKMIVFQGMQPAVIGLVIGIFGAWASSRVLEKLIFGVHANDPLTFAAVCLLLTTVALFACLMPAFRAMRVDPIQVLRDE